MSQAYTPGLQVTKRTTVEKVRELPLPGKTLVKVGQRVSPTTAVLSADLPGDLSIIRVADRMGLDPIEVSANMKVKVGDSLSKDELLCEAKTFFGLFTSKLKSPLEGEIEFYTEANAHLGVRQAPIPLNVNAYIEGTVSGIEEGKSVTITTEAALMQGIFGVGGERLGRILALDVPRKQIVSSDNLLAAGESLEGAVLIGGAQFSREALKEAAEHKVAAVITGSIDADSLFEFLGFQIGVSITGDEDVPFTLIVTEGFGCLPLSETVFKLAAELQGKSASVNGATQVRAGAMRPEVIVPSLEASLEQGASKQQKSYILEAGSRIRVIRVPYFGKLGVVTELPSEPCQIPTGASVRVLKAKLDSGEEVVVPRANVELVQ